MSSIKCSFLKFLAFLCVLSARIVGAELTLEDVHNEMSRILPVHINQNTMTPRLMALSLAHYINQFDPRHVYLTANDVEPFLNLSEREQKKLVEQYSDEDYTIFEKLNSVIQKAILAARKFRQDLIITPDTLEQLTKKPLPTIQAGALPEVKEFAKSQQELQEWQAQFIAWLVKEHMQITAAEKLTESLNDAVGSIYSALQEYEDNYLYMTKKGDPMPAKEKESLFASHILQAFMQSLDIHSEYLNPTQARNIRMMLQKEYVGIGIGIQEEGNRFLIGKIIKGSSAAEISKIHVGDEILSIDDTPVAGMSSDDVLAKLQGNPYSSVTLTLYGPDRGRFDVVLVRKTIVLQEGRVDTRFEKVPGGILGFIQLHGFYQGEGKVDSFDDMTNALDTLKKEGTLKGIVLDLRDNHGGFLVQAVNVAGLFMKCGVVVVAKDTKGDLHYLRTFNRTPVYDGPLVILVSRETASAAEIVAQCLKDYGIAVIVGDPQTYGKGSIQLETNPVAGATNQGIAAVTIGRYYTVSGQSPQDQGVKADIVVPGVLAASKVGEAYTKGALATSTIAPSYEDSLKDVPSYEKLWYQRNYLPYLQTKEDTYRKWIPELARMSKARLAKNQNYQNLLRGDNEIMNGPNRVKLDEKEANDAIRKMQDQEAAKIAQDLMHLSGEHAS